MHLTGFAKATNNSDILSLVGDEVKASASVVWVDDNNCFVVVRVSMSPGMDWRWRIRQC